jgi:hypothetical protein
MTTASRRSGVFLTIFVALLLLGARPAAAQGDDRLPAGPNRDLVARTCSTCHDLSNLTATAGRTRAGWAEKINDMVTLYGANISPADRALILDYLATYLPP